MGIIINTQKQGNIIKSTGVLMIWYGWLCIIFNTYLSISANPIIKPLSGWGWDYVLLFGICYICWGTTVKKTANQESRPYLRYLLILLSIDLVIRVIFQSPSALGPFFIVGFPLVRALFAAKQLVRAANISIEEEAYALAMKELQLNSINEGIMARCFVECKGNQELARANYVKTRAARIINERLQIAQAKTESEALEDKKRLAIRKAGSVSIGEVFLWTTTFVLLPLAALGLINLLFRKPSSLGYENLNAFAAGAGGVGLVSLLIAMYVKGNRIKKTKHHS